MVGLLLGNWMEAEDTGKCRRVNSRITEKGMRGRGGRAGADAALRLQGGWPLPQPRLRCVLPVRPSVHPASFLPSFLKKILGIGCREYTGECPGPGRCSQRIYHLSRETNIKHT